MNEDRNYLYELKATTYSEQANVPATIVVNRLNLYQTLIQHKYEDYLNYNIKVLAYK